MTSQNCDKLFSITSLNNTHMLYLYFKDLFLNFTWMYLLTSEKCQWSFPLRLANKKAPSKIISFHYFLSQLLFFCLFLHSKCSSLFVITFICLYHLHWAWTLPILFTSGLRILSGTVKVLDKYLFNGWVMGWTKSINSLSNHLS